MVAPTGGCAAGAADVVGADGALDDGAGLAGVFVAGAAGAVAGGALVDWACAASPKHAIRARVRVICRKGCIVPVQCIMLIPFRDEQRLRPALYRTVLRKFNAAQGAASRIV